MKADEFVDLVREKIMEDESGEEEAMMAQKIFENSEADKKVGLLLRKLSKESLPKKTYSGLRSMKPGDVNAAAKRAAERILAEGTRVAAEQGIFPEDVLGQMRFSGRRRTK